MPDAVTHPTLHELIAFGLGKLPERATDAVAAHLESCPVCRKAVANVPPDSFLGKVHAAKPGGSSFPPSLARAGNATNNTGQPPTPAAPCQNLPPELANHPKYHILRELGRGGMGIVYQARQVGMMVRPVVIKVIKHSLLDQPDALDRFRREVEAAAQLSHPNIVTAYDAEQVGDLHMLVMEFVPGQNLVEVVQKRGPLPVEFACHYMRQVALGLQHAHERKMVHRDIKPQNLMLTLKNQVKILDFGLAKILRAEVSGTGLTSHNVYMGTPDYCAPEQATDARSADIRADLYSLGCTLYFLLSGRPPFREDTVVKTILAHLQKQPQPLPELRADVPAQLWQVVARLLAKEPTQRYQKPIEVAQVLAPFVKKSAKSDAKNGSALGVGSSGKGTMIAADTSQIKKVLREVPGNAPPKEAPAKDAVSPFETLVETSALPRKAKGSRGSTKRVPVGWYRRWPVLVGVGVLLLALVGMWAGGAFKVKTTDGTIVLENLPPDADVLVDGGTVTVKTGDRKSVEIRVDPGKKHRLEVKKDGFKVFGEEVEIDAGGRKSVVVRLEPKERPPQPRKPKDENEKPKPIAEENEKWVSLFNDKDTTGWKTHPDNPGDWRVENGILIGRGPTPSLLFTEKDTYTDFHLRVEARINSGGDSGLCFRVPIFDYRKGQVKGRGYEAQINNTAEKGDYPLTGSLMHFPGQGITNRLIPPREWFTLEVLAEGHHVIVWLDGKKTVDFVDLQQSYRRGHLAVQVLDPSTVVEFRKIEIKELSAAKTELPTGGRDQSAIRVLQGHAGKVWQVAFSPDGKHLLSGSNSHYSVPDHVKRVNMNNPGTDNTVRLWEVETGRQVIVLRGHTWEVMGLAYCPNDSNLAAACSSTEWATDYADPRVVVYNLKSGAIRNSFRLPPRPAMRGIALSADGKRVIVCRGNSTLEAWDLTTKIKQPTVGLENGGHQNFLWCVTFTADRRHVFGGQGGGAVRLWDAETGKVIQNYLGHTRRIASVALSPNEKSIASTSDDGTVRVWDVESEKELLCLNGHEKGIGAPNENEHSVRSVVFSPDGRWILSGGWDGTVRLWDTKSGKELRRYIGHTEGVRGAAISPDGRLAASASDDKTIRLWELP